jgi:hypothetical protein
MRYVEKYCTAGQTTNGNMVHAHFIPETKGYKHTHSLFNTHCFSTAAIVTRTPSIVH